MNRNKTLKFLAFILPQGFHQKSDNRIAFPREGFWKQTYFWTFCSAFFVFVAMKVMMRLLAVP
jgi:hypothetical protein